jgi:low affinity iron permease
LDEIIRAVKGARNQLLNPENCSEEDLDKLEKQFARIRQRAKRNGGSYELAPMEGTNPPR